MYTCEAMERDKLKIANQYFSHLATKQTEALDAILACCKMDEAHLKKLIGQYYTAAYVASFPQCSPKHYSHQYRNLYRPM